jgi:hypothetical protein
MWIDLHNLNILITSISYLKALSCSIRVAFVMPNHLCFYRETSQEILAIESQGMPVRRKVPKVASSGTPVATIDESILGASA